MNDHAHISRLLAAVAVVLLADVASADEKPARPNIILCMADDLGWGDVGFNGSKVVRTPRLDGLAAAGIRFDRFYAAAPVCSPTRGSCLTGRHPYRYGIFSANVGHMPKEELTLAEALKAQGYATGHFGKWHLGTLTTKIEDSNRGRPGETRHYSPPWENGFDVCFSTEAKVPTWNPMKKPGTDEPYGTHYWTGPEQAATENLDGDDSRVIVDRVIPFVRRAAETNRPFLAVVWFHTPHLPILSGKPFVTRYASEHPRAAHYYGAITAMDEQVGRLWDELESLGVADDTMFWFASDNGPENGTAGSAGPFRGRKRSLYEGGVRVPAFVVWPARIKQPRATAVPCCTSDYYPTVVDALRLEIRAQPRPLDGVSLVPLIEGKMTERPRPIAFESGGQLALSDDRFKLYSPGRGRGKQGRRSDDRKRTWELYDLTADPGERTNIAAENRQVVERMRRTLDEWRSSCEASRDGAER